MQLFSTSRIIKILSGLKRIDRKVYIHERINDGYIVIKHKDTNDMISI